MKTKMDNQTIRDAVEVIIDTLSQHDISLPVAMAAMMTIMELPTMKKHKPIMVINGG